MNGIENNNDCKPHLLLGRCREAAGRRRGAQVGRQRGDEPTRPASNDGREHFLFERGGQKQLEGKENQRERRRPRSRRDRESEGQKKKTEERNFSSSDLREKEEENDCNAPDARPRSLSLCVLFFDIIAGQDGPCVVPLTLHALKSDQTSTGPLSNGSEVTNFFRSKAFWTSKRKMIDPIEDALSNDAPRSLHRQLLQQVREWEKARDVSTRVAWIEAKFEFILERPVKRDIFPESHQRSTTNRKQKKKTLLPLFSVNLFLFASSSSLSSFNSRHPGGIGLVLRCRLREPDLVFGVGTAAQGRARNGVGFGSVLSFLFLFSCQPRACD